MICAFTAVAVLGLHAATHHCQPAAAAVVFSPGCNPPWPSLFFLRAALASHEYIYMRWKEQVGAASRC